MKILLLTAALLSAGTARAADIFTAKEPVRLSSLTGEIAVPVSAPVEVKYRAGIRSVDFRVGEVSITIDSRPVRITSLEASLYCRFEGMNANIREKRLRSKLTETAPGRYTLNIGAGRLSASSFSKDLYSCSYLLTAQASDGSFGFINLAGSRWGMDDAAILALTGDKDLAAKLSAKYRPLRIRTKNFYVIGEGTKE